MLIAWRGGAHTTRAQGRGDGRKVISPTVRGVVSSGGSGVCRWTPAHVPSWRQSSREGKAGRIEVEALC